MRIRRLSLLVVLTLLLNAAFVISPSKVARAQDVPGLASYAPPDSAVFITLRTDDAFFDSLDAVIKQIGEKLPGMVPAINVRVALSLAFTQLGWNFESDVRPVLGDHIALFMSGLEVLTDEDTTNDNNVNVALILDIKDRAAALTLLDELLTKQKISQFFDKGEEGTYTIYRPSEAYRQSSGTPSVAAAPAAAAVNDNAMIIGTEAAIDAAVATKAKLFEQDKFKNTLALLPESSYNLLAYIDTGALIKAGFEASMKRGMGTGMGMGSMGADAAKSMEMMQKVLDAIGPTAIGATILADRSLTIDAAQTIADPTALAALGMSMASYEPIDVEFARHVPIHASAFVQFKNVAALYDSALKNATSMAAQQGQDVEQINKQIEEFQSQLLKETGINLQEDVLSWLTGNVIVFSQYDVPKPGSATIFNSPLYPDQEPANPLHQGLIIEASDTAKAAALVAKLDALLQRAATDGKFKVAKETISGTEATVVTVSAPLPSGKTASFDIVIASNDEVFVIATRGAATAILAGQPGITDDPAFKAAQALALKDTVGYGYMAQSGFALLGDLAIAAAQPVSATFSSITADLSGTPMPSPTPQDEGALREQLRKQFEQSQTMVRTIVSLFDSAFASSSVVDGTNSVSRLVLSLAK
ncbi:MAG: DUF3352 domain-containing protein [Anaerolineae bacterium]|nr:DUF3352 domain-containing protein [Anaerolineae bacterium]